MKNKLDINCNKLKTWQWLIIYTVIFVITALIIFSPFIARDKSFIWKSDGLYQTYSSMSYIGEFYRNIFNNILHGNFEIPMIDFKIGLGYDIFTTLNYYGLGDPLIILSAFVQPENTEILYNILTVLRIYLAGLAFGAYCRKIDKRGIESIAGAIIYVFCAYAICAGERHPYFVNAMIYLPLLLIGIENILHKKRAVSFSIIVFISLVSNYYFFYMLTIIAFVYAVLRFIEIYGKEWKRNFWPMLLRGAAYYILGVLISCFMFIPVVYAFMQNARGTSGSYNSGMFYGLDFYVKIIFAFFTFPRDIGNNYTFLGYAPLCTVALVYLYFDKKYRKKHFTLKSSVIIGTIMLLLPICGYIMNGMSYVSNRWVFGYSFAIACVATITFEDIVNINKRMIALFATGIIALAIPCKIMNLFKYRYVRYSFPLIIFTLLILFIISKIKKPDIKYVVLSVLLITTCGAQGFLLNDKMGEGYVEQFKDSQEAINIIRDCSESVLSEIEDKSLYRVGSFTTSQENQSLTMGYNGTTTYFSLINGCVFDFFMELEISNVPLPHRNYGFEGRSALETLASVKYFTYMLGGGDVVKMPEGFEEVATHQRSYLEDKVDAVAENMYALPIGYTYDKVISRDYLRSLTALEKQQAMMQAVVFEETKTDDSSEVLVEQHELECDVVQLNSMEWDRNTGELNVKEDNAQIVVQFNALEDEEAYLHIQGIDISGSGNVKFNPTIECGGKNNKISLTAKEFRWHIDRDDFLINLGHGQVGKTQCVITIPKKGVYKLDNIIAYSIPLSSYREQAVKLGEEVIKDVKQSTNKINGTIKVSKDKVLVFSIPYSTGWKLKVDGEYTELKKANIMYMGAEIEKGQHVIELEYCTPGIKIGIVLSIIGVIILGSVIVFDKRKSR